MKRARIETHNAPFLVGLTIAAALDSPSPEILYLEEPLGFSGWVLPPETNGSLVQVEIEVDGEIQSFSLDIERPDVISAVLGKDHDARVRCGFKTTFDNCKTARISIVVDGQKELWKEIVFDATPISELFFKLTDTDSGFARTAVETNTERYIDSHTDVSDFKSATIVTAKGKKHQVTSPIDSHQPAGTILKEVRMGFGDLYHLKYNCQDGAQFSFKGCFGSERGIEREFINFEIPRHDNSILRIPTEELLEQGSDIINLKKIIIRLRRAKRSQGGRGKFVGIEHRFIDSDLDYLRRISLQYFSTINHIVGVRYIWSLLDCFADFGSPLERTRALAISNYMHAERLAQSLKNVYSYTEKEDPVLFGQLDYWGGMRSNDYREDDSLDVFLTRAIEILSQDPLIFGYFAKIILVSASAENSILGENIRNSYYFRETFLVYKEILNRHIEAIDAESFM